MTAGAQEEPKTYDYQVKKGDTCVSIARRELGNPKAYHTIHQFNPDMGPTPHKLNPGQLLKMPLPEHPDAEITATQATVKAKAGQVGSWSQAKPGLAMYRGWRVQTFDASFADLRFVDTSTLSMSPNTMVIIYGQPQVQDPKAPARATLDHGSLRARLAELGGQDRAFELDTPSSKATFEGGETLVEVSKDGESRIENHGDGRARVSGVGNSKAVWLPKSTGTKVQKGKAPLAPRPLPASPSWQGPSHATFATSTRGATAKGGWKGVKDAVSYRLELMRYRKGAAKAPETVNVYQQDASAQQYTIKDLRPGLYAVTVAAVDDQGFTSIPSAVQQFEVHEVELKIDGQPAPLPTDFTSPLQVPHGAQLQLPGAASCVSPTIGLAHPQGLIVSGTHEVHCVQSNGQAMEPWTLVVDAPTPKSAGPRRVRLLRAHDPSAAARRPSRFDLGLGSSMWLLERGYTDPANSTSNKRLPTVFFDLGLRYAVLPWLSFGLSQHLSAPRSYERVNSVMLGASASVDFIYKRWKVHPTASGHIGYMGLIGASPNGVKRRSLPMGLDLGFEAPLAAGFAIRLKSGVMQVLEANMRSVYTTVRVGAQLSYRFGG